MNEIDQLKAVAIQKLVRSGVFQSKTKDGVTTINDEDREKFERFWSAFERNVGVCVEKMRADQNVLNQVLKPVKKKIAELEKQVKDRDRTLQSALAQAAELEKQIKGYREKEQKKYYASYLIDLTPDDQNAAEAPVASSSVVLRGVFSISAGMILLCVKGALGWGWFLLTLILFLVGFFFPRRE